MQCCARGTVPAGPPANRAGWHGCSGIDGFLWMAGAGMDQEQRSRIAHGTGFFAALDQSGGSTPKALSQYGVDSFADEGEMFDLMHEFRARIITSPSFDGARILGAILFEQTMDRDISGVPS